MTDTDTDNGIVIGTLDGLRVSDAVLTDDGELITRTPPAADENWSLGDFD